jgi:hypothetical protein
MWRSFIVTERRRIAETPPRRSKLKARSMLACGQFCELAENPAGPLALDQ